MSFHDCISSAVAEGFLSREEGDRLHETHRRNRAAQGGLGLDDAQAAQTTFDALEMEVAQRRRQKLIAAAAQQQVAFDMRGYRDEIGRTNLNDGGRALYDSTSFGGKVAGVFQMRENIRGILHETMAKAFEKFERNIVGETRNKATLSEMVDALFGSTTISAAARELAEGWRLAAERARLMFNEAGGHIGYRADWGLPQGHDAEAITKAGYQAWRDFVLPLLDREKMIDGRTGQTFHDSALELALDDTWKAITTEGWSRREASGSARGASIGNSRADPRFLVLKDGASWRAYMERFGEGDSFKIMNNYLDGMARDIALMKRFGPNPSAGAEYAEQLLIREAALSRDPKAKLAATQATSEMATMYEHETGAAGVPGNKAMASWASEARQWLVGAQLGGAALGAITDVGFQQVTAAFNGLPGWRVLARHMALLNPANAFDRETAIGSGLIAEEAAQVLSTEQRHYGEAWGSGVSRRVADATLRASGLSAWTQAGRWAFGLEMLAFMGRHADHSFDQLPALLRGSMERYGIDATSWDLIRPAVWDRGGSRFVKPSLVEDQAVSMKLRNLVRSETNFAVPSVSLYGRAALGGSLRPGTISGELFRSFLMYKNFGVTVLMTHGRRAAMQTTWRGKLGYGGALLASTTLMGALALQAKEIAKGRDPRPMLDSDGSPVPGMKFMTAAMLQGGGAGIFGDLLFADQNRFGGGLPETIAGPMFTGAKDFVGVGQKVAHSAVDLAKGKHTAGGVSGGDFVHLAERYTPGGSIWYARLAYQRMILDQVREMTDPDAGDYQRRLMQRYKTDYSQNFWWKAGEALPQRAPDMGEALDPETPPKRAKH